MSPQIFLNGKPLEGVTNIQIVWEPAKPTPEPALGIDVSQLRWSYSLTFELPRRTVKRHRYLAGQAPSWQYPGRL